MTTSKPSIYQMLPALPGWFVIRARAGTEGAAGDYARDPIVGWASLPDQRLVPITIFAYTPHSEPVLPLDVLTSAPDFLGYDYPGCPVDWREATRAFHRDNWIAEEERWRAEPPLRRYPQRSRRPRHAGGPLIGRKCVPRRSTRNTRNDVDRMLRVLRPWTGCDGQCTGRYTQIRPDQSGNDGRDRNASEGVGYRQNTALSEQSGHARNHQETSETRVSDASRLHLTMPGYTRIHPDTTGWIGMRREPTEPVRPRNHPESAGCDGS